MRAAPRAASACPSEFRTGALPRVGAPSPELAPTRAAVQRLKTRAQFQAVMAGATVSRTAHFALHRIALPLPAVAAPAAAQDGARALFAADDVWIGAVLPKRWARRAVTRNAIRRQIYAAADAHAAVLPRAVHVVRLRSGFDRQQFVSATSERLKAAVRGELEQLMRKAASSS